MKFQEVKCQAFKRAKVDELEMVLHRIENEQESPSGGWVSEKSFWLCYMMQSDISEIIVDVDKEKEKNVKILRCPWEWTKFFW